MDIQDIQSQLEYGNNKIVLKSIMNKPYIERKELAGILGFSVEEIDVICQEFIDRMVILELASQSSSNIESRVPRKVYLINPEMEETIKQIL
jgi:hypothetical protein